MDVYGLLKLRIDFLRQLHERACRPFQDIRRQIEDGEPPFEPPYSEDGEPPFLAEWIEAEESIQVIGYSCLSMLSAALKLYFHEWERHLHISAKDPQLKCSFKKGWLKGYECYFRKTLGIGFDACEVPMLRLEEIARARNVAQHPDHLWGNTASFTDDDLEVLREPFFSSEVDRRLAESATEEGKWFLPVTLHVPPEKLAQAILDVLSFAAWLSSEIHRAKDWNDPVYDSSSGTEW